MHDDGLKQLWQEQSFTSVPAMPDDRLLASMKRKTKSFETTLRWKHFSELATCILGIFFFGIGLALGDDTAMTQLGLLVLVFSCLFIGWRIVSSRAGLPRAGTNQSVIEGIEVELVKVETQIRLLRSAFPLHILPIFTGLTLVAWGDSAPLSERFVSVAQVLILCAAALYLNHFTVKNKLQPLKAELESLLSGSETICKHNSMKNYYMKKTIIIAVALALCWATDLLGATKAKSSDPKPSSAPVEEQKVEISIPEMLETIRKNEKLPALAAVVVVDGKVVATNAVGVRRYGGTETVSVDDKFHIGSVTKSMTATVAGMLVEAGKISWTTTIGESFPEFKEQIHRDYLGITLEQLLAHRGGVPGRPPLTLWAKAWKATGTPGEQRLEFIKGILERKPKTKPGTKHIYSNQGYSIAGVMMEMATGKSWEDLMRSMLFEPLGMESAGFGAPSSLYEVDQPWGHTVKLWSGHKPVPPGPRSDNPLAISPAGAVHCSVGDLAKYAAFHMAGKRGESKLLKAETFKKLHESAGDNYALGWVVHNRVLWHNGSNTMFYVMLWMSPDTNKAVITATNAGTYYAISGCDQALGKLIARFPGK